MIPVQTIIRRSAVTPGRSERSDWVLSRVSHETQGMARAPQPRTASTFGIVAPPRTPQPIVDKLRAALKAAVESEAYAESQRKVGNARFFEDAPEYKAWLEKDFARWGAVIREGNIKAQ